MLSASGVMWVAVDACCTDWCNVVVVGGCRCDGGSFGCVMGVAMVVCLMRALV